MKEPLSGSLQIRRLDLKTGETVDITAGESSGAAAGRFSSGGGAAPARLFLFTGRALALRSALAWDSRTALAIEFKGHKYGPRTALWIRDLKTGGERMVMDPIDPMSASGSKTLGTRLPALPLGERR